MFGLDGIDHLRVSRIAQRLIGQKETIGISESSAGGLILAALLSVPGASAYFLGGGVIYTRKAMGALSIRVLIFGNWAWDKPLVIHEFILATKPCFADNPSFIFVTNSSNTERGRQPECHSNNGMIWIVPSRFNLISIGFPAFQPNINRHIGENYSHWGSHPLHYLCRNGGDDSCAFSLVSKGELDGNCLLTECLEKSDANPRSMSGYEFFTSNGNRIS